MRQRGFIAGLSVALVTVLWPPPNGLGHEYAETPYCEITYSCEWDQVSACQCIAGYCNGVGTIYAYLAAVAKSANAVKVSPHALSEPTGRSECPTEPAVHRTSCSS